MPRMNETSLILLHGWGMNPRVFELLIAELGAQRTLLAPALPGYPQSRWPHATDFARQIDAMAESLPRGQLLGWSLGGLYALELVLRYPQKFERLILAACNPCFVARTGWPCAVASSVFDEFGDGLESDPERALRRFLSLQMRGEAAARDMTRGLWRQVTETGLPDIGVLRFGLQLLKSRDYTDRLGEIEVPVSLILGEIDSLVPIDLAQQIVELAPAIQVESIAGAAHAPFLSYPTQVAALL